MEVRFCAACGTERLPGAGFCGTCGHAYAGITAPGPRGAAPQAEIEASWEPTPALPPEPAWEAEPLPSFDAGSPTELLPPPVSWVPVAEPVSLLPPPIPVVRPARRSRTGRRTVGIMLAISGAAIVVAAVAIAFLVLRREPVAVTAALGSPTPGPSATWAPTPMPATPVPATPVPTAGPTPEPALTTFSAFELDSLRQAVPWRLAQSCIDLTPQDWDPAWAADARAMVRCPSADGERTGTYMRTDSVSAYESFLAESGLSYDSGGCWDGSPGEVPWSYGRAVCFVSGEGTPVVAWTDDGSSVVAFAKAMTGSLQDLVGWWWNAALLPAGPSGTGNSVHEDWLLGQVPASLGCRPYDAVQDAEDNPGETILDPVGDLGAIDCWRPAKGIRDIGWFRFTTPEALDAWYTIRAGLAEVVLDSGGCFDGTAGETAWEYGRVMCYGGDGNGKAKIRWTNEDSLTYGALTATNGDLPTLFAWWRANGMP